MVLHYVGDTFVPLLMWGDAVPYFVCPVCEHEHNWYTDVRVFERKREAGQTFVKTPGSNVLRLSAFNPSPTRCAVQIQMQCENGHVWLLNLIEYDDRTVITQDFDPMQD